MPRARRINACCADRQTELCGRREGRADLLTAAARRCASILGFYIVAMHRCRLRLIKRCRQMHHRWTQTGALRQVADGENISFQLTAGAPCLIVTINDFTN